MRWISARLAWHDAFYNGRPSVMAVARENAALGAAVQCSNWGGDPAAHQAECGQVQHVISQLPQKLQDVGNWLYAPYTAEERAARANNVLAIVAREADLINLVPAGNWRPLIIAIMYEYARVALGEDVRRATGRVLKRWMREQLQHEWGDWTTQDRRVYEALWSAMNELDKQALDPVARLVHDQRDKRECA